MTLVKCKKCKKEISSTAKYCPHCGTIKTIYCRKCGKEMHSTEQTCPSCGYPTQEVINTQINTKGEKYDLAFIGIICAMFFPIAGLILGFIALDANRGLNNDASNIGKIAITLSVIEMLLKALAIVLYIVFLIFTNYSIIY